MLSTDILLRVQNAFDRFVGEICDEVLQRTEPRHGRLREVSILFADLRDFTGWVESTPPEEVAEGLSASVTAMECAIRRHRGLVLQFTGDEIEAIFGVPARCAVHADMAVAARAEGALCGPHSDCAACAATDEPRRCSICRESSHLKRCFHSMGPSKRRFPRWSRNCLGSCGRGLRVRLRT